MALIELFMNDCVVLPQGSRNDQGGVGSCWGHPLLAVIGRFHHTISRLWWTDTNFSKENARRVIGRKELLFQLFVEFQVVRYARNYFRRPGWVRKKAIE